MAKKSTHLAPPRTRQAKIQAAQKSQGSGANKIVVATVVAVVAIIAVVGGVIWMRRARRRTAPAAATRCPTGVSALGAGLPGVARTSRPPPNAPTVDLYEDFQCPACAQFEAALGATVPGAWPRQGKIKLVYHVHELPRRQTCATTAPPAAANARLLRRGRRQVPGVPRRGLRRTSPRTRATASPTPQLKALRRARPASPVTALTTWQTVRAPTARTPSYVNSVERGRASTTERPGHPDRA